MISFKSPDDLSKLPPHHPAYPIIEDLAKKLLVNTESTTQLYDYEAYGWIVLTTDKHDTVRPLTEIWGDDAYRLTEIPWEGISRHENGFYIGVFLANNDFGLVFVIPDEPWLSNELVEVLEDNLIPAPNNLTT